MSRPKYRYDLPAVVLGIDELTGIQTARILSERGVPVVGVASDPHHYAMKSNSVVEAFAIPAMEEPLIDALVAKGKKIDPRRPVLIPCTDDYVSILSNHRAVLGQYYRFSLPDAATVGMLAEKTSFSLFATREGLAVPATFILDSLEDAEAAAAKLSFPAVLKPEKKSPLWWDNTHVKALTIDDAAQLIRRYKKYSAWSKRLVVQEFVEGGEEELYSCNCYFGADAKPLVTFIARKIRQWPPVTGITSLGEECRNDEVLHESVRFLERAGYRGLGYVEVKRDTRSGKHKIIEVNVGRPTGRSALAETCGVELLMTMYCDLAELPLPEARVQRYQGGKWIQIVNDTRSAWYHWRRGELTVGQWLRSLRGVREDAIIRFSDPAATFGYFAELTRRVLFSREAPAATVSASPPAQTAPATPKSITPV